MTLDLVHCASLVTQSCLPLCGPTDRSLPVSSVHGDSPGRNTGEGCHAIFQGIFWPRQGSIPSLLHCRWILYQRVAREALVHCKISVYASCLSLHTFHTCFNLFFLYMVLKTIFISFQKMTVVFLIDSMFPVLLLLRMWEKLYFPAILCYQRICYVRLFDKVLQILYSPLSFFLNSQMIGNATFLLWNVQFPSWGSLCQRQ